MGILCMLILYCSEGLCGRVSFSFFAVFVYNTGMKKFEDLTISDDYMLYHAMQNEDLCRTLLSSR